MEFVPERVGYYKIDIRVNDKSLAICPIVCEASLDESDSSFRQSSSDQAELDLSEVQVVGLQNDVVDVQQRFKGICL